MQAFIGFDAREPRAYRVASETLARTSGLQAQPLMREALRDRGLLWRPEDRRGHVHDLSSGANVSTDFAISRFLTPILAQTGWAIFADCDVAFLGDVQAALRPHLDEDRALLCVQHMHTPTTTTKMDGQAQSVYSRKNWSSFMVFNAGHPANRRLSLHDVNARPGLWLHQFGWLHDSEIGRLPQRFNWLVGEHDEPDGCIVAHWTLGGPFTPGWKGGPHDDRWLAIERSLKP